MALAGSARLVCCPLGTSKRFAEGSCVGFFHQITRGFMSRRIFATLQKTVWPIWRAKPVVCRNYTEKQGS
jgi:hypothetical protein